VSQDRRGDIIHVQGPLFINSWKLDVCDVLHKTIFAHAVGVVRRYIKNPGKVHWEAVKWILKYLRGTTTHALYFRGS
jgi:hypothetical protein